MYASIPDALRALARKIGADANGRHEEEILNNIAVKLGGTPVTNHGVAGSIDAITKVVDLDVMHNLGTLEVTPSTTAQSITPESPVDGYSSVSVSAVTSAIDQNIVAGNIKKDVQILGVTGSYEGSGGSGNATLTPDSTEFSYTHDYANLLTAITIPSSVTSIGDEAFSSCTSLTAITIPSSVTSIGDNAFCQCTSLANVTIPEGVESIGVYAFQDCESLTAITIPSSVTSTGAYVFDHCTSLANVTISEGVESIGVYAFMYCESLTAITIPSSVTSIGAYAFDGCTSLTTITIHKAEGSISDAPWGAPNATVVWDG